jgi:hypothetical protein
MASGAPDQLVYLSNRPAVLAETLGYVHHFMPWIRQAVVLAPTSCLDELKRATDASGIDVVLVDEGALLTPQEQASLPSRHGERNTTLRRALLARGPVDDIFLQSDDDYRPLKPVDSSLFAEDGRLVPYAYYDLALWRRNESSYDRGQHISYLVLSYLGAGTLGFASHMPQAIDKALAIESFDVAERVTGGIEFDEWSLPINYAIQQAPERFTAPRTFRTMCWPQYPHEWPYWRRPEDLTFENFYPELYQPGRLFAGISTALDADRPEQQAFAKLDRWHTFDLEAAQLRFPKGVANPWQTSTGRRLFFWSARRARKLYEYAALEERTRLADLAGAVARLEQKP